MADVWYKTGSFNTTSSADTVIDVTDVGTNPKAVHFWYTYNTADNTVQSHNAFGHGFAATGGGGGSGYGFQTNAQDGASNTHRSNTNVRGVHLRNPTNDAEVINATISFTSTTVRLFYVDTSVNYRMHYEIWGGDDVTAEVDEMAVSTSPFSGLTMTKPDLVLIATTGNVIINASQHAFMSYGAAHDNGASIDQWCLLSYMGDNDEDVWGSSLVDGTIAGQMNLDYTNWTAAITAIGSNGFTWTGTNADEWASLSLDFSGEGVDVGSFTKATGTAPVTQALPDLGFTPQGVHLATANFTAQTINNDRAFNVAQGAWDGSRGHSALTVEGSVTATGLRENISQADTTDIVLQGADSLAASGITFTGTIITRGDSTPEIEWDPNTSDAIHIGYYALEAQVLPDITITDGLVFGQTFNISATGTLDFTDPITFGETLNISATGSLSITIALAFGHTADLIPTANLGLTDGLTFGETFDISATGTLDFTDPITFGETLDISATGSLSITIALAFGHTANLVDGAGDDITITDGLVFGETFDVNALGSLNFGKQGNIVHHGFFNFLNPAQSNPLTLSNINVGPTVDGVFVFWSYDSDLNGAGLTSITLAGVAPDETFEVPMVTATTESAAGVAAWYNPPSNGVASDFDLVINWDDDPIEGPVVVLWEVRLCDPLLVDVQGVNESGTDAATVTLTGIEATTHWSSMWDTRLTTTPASTASGWTNRGTSTGNNRAGKMATRTATGTSEVVESQDDNQSALIAIAIRNMTGQGMIFGHTAALNAAGNLSCTMGLTFGQSLQLTKNNIRFTREPPPSLLSTSNGNDAATGPIHTLTYPTTIEAGSLLVAVALQDLAGNIFFKGQAGAETSVLDDNSTWDFMVIGSVGTSRFNMSWKIADGTESGTFEINGGLSSADMVWGVWAYSPSSNLASEFDFFGFPGTGNPDAPSNTTAWSGEINRWLTFYAQEQNGLTTAYPTGYDDDQYTASIGTASVGSALGFASRALESDTENPGAFTVDLGGQSFFAQNAAARPPKTINFFSFYKLTGAGNLSFTDAVPTLVQSAIGTWAGGNAVLPGTATPGNLLIGFAAHRGVGGTPFGTADTVAGWTLRDSEPWNLEDTAWRRNMSMYTRTAQAGDDTFAPVWDPAGNAGITFILEFSGTNEESFLDAVMSNNGDTDNALSLASGSTAGSHEGRMLKVAAMSIKNFGVDVDSDFTFTNGVIEDEIVYDGTTVQENMGVAWGVVNRASPQTESTTGSFTGTITSNRGLIVGLAVFQSQATGPVFGESLSLNAVGELSITMGLTFGQTFDVSATGTLDITDGLVFGHTADLTSLTSEDITITDGLIFGETFDISATGTLDLLDGLIFGETFDVNAIGTLSHTSGIEIIGFEAVTFAAGLDPVAESITVPAACTGLIVSWHMTSTASGGNPDDFGVKLDGVSPDDFFQQGSHDPEADAPGRGFYYWRNPNTGTIDLDVLFTEVPTEGSTCIVVYLRNTNPIALSAFDGSAAKGTTEVSVTLGAAQLNDGDTIIKFDSKTGGTAPGTQPSWTSIGTHTNNSRSMRASFVVSAGNAEVCDARNENDSALMAIAIPAVSTADITFGETLNISAVGNLSITIGLTFGETFDVSATGTLDFIDGLVFGHTANLSSGVNEDLTITTGLTFGQAFDVNAIGTLNAGIFGPSSTGFNADLTATGTLDLTESLTFALTQTAFRKSGAFTRVGLYGGPRIPYGDFVKAASIDLSITDGLVFGETFDINATGTLDLLDGLVFGETFDINATGRLDLLDGLVFGETFDINATGNLGFTDGLTFAIATADATPSPGLIETTLSLIFGETFNISAVGELSITTGLTFGQSLPLTGPQIYATVALTFGETFDVSATGTLDLTDGLVFGHALGLTGEIQNIALTTGLVFGETFNVNASGRLDLTDGLVFGETFTITGILVDLTLTTSLVFGETFDINATGTLDFIDGLVFGETFDINALGTLDITEGLVFGENFDISGFTMLAIIEALNFGETFDISATGRLSFTTGLAFGQSLPLTGPQIYMTTGLVFGEVLDISGQTTLDITANLVFGETFNISAIGELSFSTPITFGHSLPLTGPQIYATINLAFGETFDINATGTLDFLDGLVFGQTFALVGEVENIAITEALIFGETFDINATGTLGLTESLVFGHAFNLTGIAENITITMGLTFGQTFNVSATGTLDLTASLIFGETLDISPSPGLIETTLALTFGESFNISASGALDITEALVFGDAFDINATGALDIVSGLVFGQALDLTSPVIEDLDITVALVFGETFDLDAIGSIELTDGLIFGQTFDVSATGSLSILEGLVFGEDFQIFGGVGQSFSTAITFGHTADLRAVGELSITMGLAFGQSLDINAPVDITITMGLVFGEDFQIGLAGTLDITTALAFGHAANLTAIGNLSVTAPLTFGEILGLNALANIATSPSLVFATERYHLIGPDGTVIVLPPPFIDADVELTSDANIDGTITDVDVDRVVDATIDNIADIGI